LRDVDRIAGRQARSLPVDFHLEVTLDDVNRLGLVVVSVGRERPAHRRAVYEQAEHATGVLGREVDLGANATRHPDYASIRCHAQTITPWLA
jgi:hypothetical protein